MFEEPGFPKSELTVALPTTLSDKGYLLECIRSLDVQTLKAFELIIFVDGASHNLAILEEVMEQYARPYRVIVSRKQRGVARALNILARLAQTDYIARMDDDDRCHPQRLERCLRELKKNRYDVVGTAANLIDLRGDVVGSGFPMDFSKKQSFRDLIFGPLFFHPSVVYSRSWIRLNKYERGWTYGEDRDLWIRCYPFSSYHNIQERLIDYRVRPISHPVYLKAVKNRELLIEKYVEDRETKIYLRLLTKIQKLRLYIGRISLRVLN